jgi:hypothetical protein
MKFRITLSNRGNPPGMPTVLKPPAMADADEAYPPIVCAWAGRATFLTRRLIQEAAPFETEPA